ncbi:cytidylyltransferase domain-containing protein [Arcicella rosea]|uniref:Spore coat polysaccharide biosynthesis protein SpsF n=1 Tax=Arcicella rosea TaxID=502909 RepID=A0A841ER38_9BACT|nr:glycosyltransferase family protein [Arcicella rosea]MBB6001901.1 spore coat polysaccharide biosynthesis protein SpsF [Arcicella rosea]
MTSISIVVQARMSSSRLPKKVLLPILGESLLYRMIERLQQIKHKTSIVIATSENAEDDVIEEFCQAKNITCFRGSLNNLLDRHYQVGVLTNADIVIKIPSDCPLIDPRIVDKVLDFYFENEGKYDFVSNLHPATYPDGNDVEIMTSEALKKAWQEATRPLELEHTTPYFWENPDKFRLANVTWKTGLDYSMSHRFTIDYYEDYLFIKRVFEELYPQNPAFSLEDILSLLQEKPEIYEINQHFAGVNWYRNHLDELKTISQEQTKLSI